MEYSKAIFKKGGNEMNLLKFKAKCVEANVSRSDLCRMWERNMKTVSNKMTGKTAITLDEAQTFAKYANLSDTEKVDIFLS